MVWMRMPASRASSAAFSGAIVPAVLAPSVRSTSARRPGSLSNCASENIVALCDVDGKRAASTFERYPQAKRYKDFRKMLDEVDKQIDAVVVSTPDHTHAVHGVWTAIAVAGMAFALVLSVITLVIVSTRPTVDIDAVDALVETAVAARSIGRVIISTDSPASSSRPTARWASGWAMA